jgi:microcystin-dependent protein
MDSPFIGMIAALPYTFCPSGWVRCNGQAIIVAQNPALYALIKNQFGGNNATFNVPDLRGRTIVGSTVTSAGPGLGYYPQGQTGGFEGITLLPTQMPVHTHTSIIANANAPVRGAITATVNAGTGTGNVGPAGNYLGGTTANGDNFYTAANGVTLNAGTVSINATGLNATLTNVQAQIGNAGGNQSHENRMPYLAIQYCMATQGIYPTQS